MPYRKNGFTRTNFVKQNLGGFTLIELLVTITIIAILAAIGLVTYSMALKQGRDSKRQSDLRAIQSALEQYNSDQLFYPYTSGAPDNPPGLDTRLGQGGQFNSNIGNSAPAIPTPKIYMNSLPRDSISTTPYRYSTIPPTCTNATTARCTSYCLYATLENVSTQAPLPSGCAYPSNIYNFVVTLP